MVPGAASLLLLVFAQSAQTMTPAEWSGESRPAEVREVRCPERLPQTECSRLTSVVVSLTRTSVNRRKFRDLFGEATVDVDIRDAVVDVTVSVPPARMAAVLDSPLRLQWDPQSASWLVSGYRLRAVFDALQEFLAGLAPELTGRGLMAFERGGKVSLNVRSGGSHLQIAVDRAGKRLFLGAASSPLGPSGPAPAAPATPAAPVGPPVAPPAMSGSARGCSRSSRQAAGGERAPAEPLLTFMTDNATVSPAGRTTGAEFRSESQVTRGADDGRAGG